MKRIKILFFLFSFVIYASTGTIAIEAAGLLSGWNNTTPLPVQISSNTLIASEGILYIFGGANTDIVNINSQAKILADGHISSWSTTNNNSENLFWHSAQIKDKYVYLIGGATYPLITYSNKIYLGKLNDLGEVDSWSLLTNLPKALALSSSYIVNDRLYVTGGFSNSGVNQDIYHALINPDGSISDWTYGGQLNEPRYGHTFFEHNGYFYTVGGKDNFGNYFTQIYRQEADENGNIGLATPLNQLPLGTARNSTVKIGNKIIVMGGESPIGMTNKIYYSDILPDGNLTEWSTSSINLPGNYCCGAAAAFGEYIYYTGGHDGTNYSSEVYFTKVDSTSPPDPTTVNLSVDLLKQTSDPWQDDIYDTANLWSPLNATVNRWGCAMTSAVMVLNYHGLRKINTSDNLNPETMNAWLKNQPDGYIGSGMVNWLAISRLSKQIKSYNPSFPFDALEYKKVRGMDDETLTSDLENNNPGILGVVGHFVVAKGKDAETFLINDPFYERTKLNDGYNNEYISLGRYIPSNTDLSYILLVHNAEVDTTLDNSTGQSLGEDFSEESIIDPVIGVSNGATIKQKYIPQPTTGDYTITVTTTGTNPFTLDVYLYDVNGNVKKLSRTGNVDDSTSKSYSLHFDKTSLTNSTIPSDTEVITFAKFYADLKSLYQSKKIGPITYALLIATLKDIESDYKKKKITQAVKKIDLFILVIKKLPTRDASKPVKDLLLKNLEGLRIYVKQ